jgi:hypothetical protein
MKSNYIFLSLILVLFSLPAFAKPEEGLSQKQVMTKIREEVGAIQKCYEEGVARKPGLKGDLDVKWTITPDGHTSNIYYSRNTLKDKAVETCIKTIFQNQIYPVAENGKSTNPFFPLKFDKK